MLNFKRRTSNLDSRWSFIGRASMPGSRLWSAVSLVKLHTVLFPLWYKHPHLSLKIAEAHIEVNPEDAKRWKKEMSKVSPTASADAKSILDQAKAVGAASSSSSPSSSRPRVGARPTSKSASISPKRGDSSSRGDRRRSRSRSPDASGERDSHRGRSPARGTDAMQGVLKQLQEMQRELTALKTQRNVESDDEEEEMFVLDPKVPNVKAPMSQMKRKLGASTKLGQIKGIYDLLVPRDVQAKTSGKGNGRYQSVNADVFKAMERFFSKRFKFETASMIVEAINEKGAQARVHKKKKQSKKTKARKEKKEGNKSETEDEEDEEDEDDRDEDEDGDGEEGEDKEGEDLERKGKDKDKGKKE